MSHPIPEKLTKEELLRLRDNCMDRIREGQLHELRNDAKLRAVTSTESYEEFKNIVDAAHMTPISRADKMNAKTRNRLWNSAVRDE